MKNILKIFFIILISCFVCDVQAKIDNKKSDSNINFLNKKNNFSKKIISFFKKRDIFHHKFISVKIKNLSRIKNFCNFPKVVVYPNSPIWGDIIAKVFCNGVYQNIFVKVTSKGKYIASNSKINLGSVISESDLITKIGKLEELPSDVCFKKDQILKKISSKNISIGEPITLSMFREPWKVHVNQTVSVIFIGQDFIIINQGKALKNAFEKDIINVAIDGNNNTIIEGIVNNNGEIIYLRNIY
ncbi:Flagella basal body P-ring formation protein FlgA [Buchnera aphidicola (Tetraneura ulmi)]|uniref:flagellar basal body P-ring formation chaperone FlgA n=1 Tax=Buchnera aphidicola TaxID=9 RepID=UPI003463C92C